MYLVYAGESGNTGSSLNDPNQPHHVHVGLLVHESQSVAVTGEFDALFRRHFGQAPGPRRHAFGAAASGYVPRPRRLRVLARGKETRTHPGLSQHPHPEGDAP